MKKIIVVAFAAGTFVFAANAQDPVATPEKAPMSKEDKEKMKLKQEQELSAIFKEVGLTEDQEKQVRAVMEESKQKNNTIKKDDALKEEDKTAKLKAANDEKNAKMKEIMGAEKYSLYNAIKKKQKEQAGAKPADQ
ncbi:MAG: hypothetical protein V4722_27270 [Bacteroidota bacterium]